MRKKEEKKLKLVPERVRVLTPSQLVDAAGGHPIQYTQYSYCHCSYTSCGG